LQTSITSRLLFELRLQHSPYRSSALYRLRDRHFNTLWTGDADLRLYITIVQDGWRKSAF